MELWRGEGGEEAELKVQRGGLEAGGGGGVAGHQAAIKERGGEAILYFMFFNVKMGSKVGLPWAGIEPRPTLVQSGCDSDVTDELQPKG